MKHTICPYCGKTNIDNDTSFRFKCSYCKEWLIDLDKNHCRPEVNWRKENERSKSYQTLL